MLENHPHECRPGAAAKRRCEPGSNRPHERTDAADRVAVHCIAGLSPRERRQERPRRIISSPSQQRAANDGDKIPDGDVEAAMARRGEVAVVAECDGDVQKIEQPAKIGMHFGGS